jgi:prevent-host-death family protein
MIGIRGSSRLTDIVNIHEAKTHLSRLLERVRRGHVVTIAKAGTPIARLVPFGRAAGVRQVRETTALPISPVASERAGRLKRFLEQEVWPTVPDHQRGRVLTREQEDAILGHGPEGV